MMAAKIIPQATYDTAAAEAKQAEARVAELRAHRAQDHPRSVDGVLGIPKSLGSTSPAARDRFAAIAAAGVCELQASDSRKCRGSPSDRT